MSSYLFSNKHPVIYSIFSSVTFGFSIFSESMFSDPVSPTFIISKMGGALDLWHPHPPPASWQLWQSWSSTASSSELAVAGFESGTWSSVWDAVLVVPQISYDTPPIPLLDLHALPSVCWPAMLLTSSLFGWMMAPPNHHIHTCYGASLVLVPSCAKIFHCSQHSFPDYFLSAFFNEQTNKSSVWLINTIFHTKNTSPHGTVYCFELVLHLLLCQNLRVQHQYSLPPQYQSLHHQARITHLPIHLHLWSSQLSTHELPLPHEFTWACLDYQCEFRFLTVS